MEEIKIQDNSKTKYIKAIPYKERIAIRGNKTRSEEINEYFKNLGAYNPNNFKCDLENLVYFINDNNELDCRNLIDDSFKIYNIEDFVKENKCKNLIFNKLQIKFINELTKLKNNKVILLKKRNPCQTKEVNVYLEGSEVMKRMSNHFDGKALSKEIKNKVMKKYKLLFIDLDDTLIKTKSGKTFPQGIWDMEFKFDVLDAIKRLQPKYVCIVSNQGGIELGHVEYMHVVSKISYARGVISDYCKIDYSNTSYKFCMVNKKGHPCRKPNTGMLEEYFKQTFNGFRQDQLEKQEILMVGDASGKQGQFSDSDKKCAENFGIDYLDVNDFVNIKDIIKENK